MKTTILISAVLFSILVKAEEPKVSAPAPAAPKMTTKDAKKTCKEEGKTGAELIQCMKDKKEEK
jgi:hypothetical protein